MKSPKVSVVVPVYNVAEYLPRCLDSLAAQSLESLDVILVNDGSTDGGGDILRGYAAKERRFRVIEKANGGCSAARNAGLDAATGEYVGFVDADDWVDPDMFAHLQAMAGSADADVAQCGFGFYFQDENRHEVRDNSLIPPLLARTGGTLRGAEAVLFDDVAIWKNVYRRSMLESRSLRFDETMAIGEDAPFHLTALCLARRIAASDRAMYHYRKERPGQATTISDTRLFAFFRIFTTMAQVIHREGLEYLRPWLLHLEISRHCYGYELAGKDVRPEYFRRWREALVAAGVTAKDEIAAGCTEFGGVASRARWLVLQVVHPWALRAVLQGDRAAFERLISWRGLGQGVLANPLRRGRRW